MDILKILHLINFFSIYVTLFFLIATFLVEKKGNLNGGKSWYRIGIVVCAAIFWEANVLEQNLETVEKYSLSQKMIYWSGGGLTFVMTPFMLLAGYSAWRLFSKRPSNVSNIIWINRCLLCLGIAFTAFVVFCVGPAVITNN